MEVIRDTPPPGDTLVEPPAGEPPAKRLCLGEGLMRSYRAYHSDAAGLAQPVPANAIVAPNVSRGTGALRKQVEDIRESIQTSYPLRSQDIQKVLMIAKFLCDENIAGYMPSQRHRLAILMLCGGEHWRAHKKITHRYDRRGAWVAADRLAIDAWDHLTAVEGLFVAMTLLDTPPERYRWEDFEVRLQGVLGSLGPPTGLMAALQDVAKQESDVSRRKTNNKVWKAHWTSRVADMISRLRTSWDAGTACSDKLMKLFLVEFETRMPISCGVAFADKYLDDDWNEAEPSPTNNCYTLIRYPLQIDESLLAPLGVSLAERRETVNSLLESIYFHGGPQMSAKMSFLHAAFKRRNAGKMCLQCSGGGTGKGVDAKIDKTLVGPENFAILDVSAFIDRGDWRRDAGAAYGKMCVRTQEGPGSDRLEPDLIKGYAVGEEKTVRVNYGFAEQIDFGYSYKALDCNPESVPVFERARGGCQKMLYQNMRRIVCFLMNRVTFTTDPLAVDHSAGIYLIKTEDEIDQILAHPLTPTLIMNDWVLPFFRANKIEDCLRGITDLTKFGGTMLRDTEWAARRISGIYEDIPSSVPASSQTIAPTGDTLLRDCHRGTPPYKVVRTYLIEKLDCFPPDLVVKKSKKGKRSRMEHFHDVLEGSDMKLFRARPDGHWDRLALDVDKMQSVIDELGGAAVFGSWAEWSDIWEVRDEQSTWDCGGYIDPRQPLPEMHGEPEALWSTVVQERIDIDVVSDQNDRFAYGSKKQRVAAWIDRHKREGSRAAGESTCPVRYCMRKPFPRIMADGMAIQGTASEAREDGIRRKCVQADAPLCHFRLLLRRLQRLGLAGPGKYSHLKRLCQHYGAHRLFAQRYFDISAAESKLVLIKIGYGGQQQADVPFLRYLAHEMSLAAAEILTSVDCRWVNAFYGGRRNPQFSRLCAILSGDESAMMMKFCEVVYGMLPNGINGLVYDGCEVYCGCIGDEAVAVYAAAETLESCGMEMKINAWPKSYAHVSTIAHRLLVAAKIRCRPAVPARTASRGGCLLFAVCALDPSVALPAGAWDAESMSVRECNALVSGSDTGLVGGGVVDDQTAKFVLDSCSAGEKVVVHQRIDGSDGHFFAVSACSESCGLVINDSMFPRFELRVEADALLEEMKNTGGLTWFRLGTARDIEIQGDLPIYDIRGAGYGVKTRSHRAPATRHHVLKRPARKPTRKQQLLYARTPYNGPKHMVTRRPAIRIDRLKEDVKEREISSATNTKARRLLSKFGFMPTNYLRSRLCYRCGGSLFRASRGLKCGSCKTRIHDDAYTPLHYRRGGQRAGAALEPKEYLRLAWCYGFRVPCDVACAMTGCGQKKVSRVYSYLAKVTASATRVRSSSIKIDEGLVEADSNKTITRRKDPDTNIHAGRMLVAVDRATGKTAYAMLPDQLVKKGAATVPESFREVKPHLDMWLGSNVVLCGDGAKSWAKYAKSRGYGKVAAANHGKKVWVQVTKLPAPRGSSAAWLLQKMGHPRKRVLRVKGGDQRAEAAIQAVKRVLRRRNQLFNANNIGTNAMAAAFNRENPGLRPLGKAVRMFLAKVVDRRDPASYLDSIDEDA